MTLLNFGTDHTASPHGGGIDPKTMRGVVIGIVLVLAVIGTLAIANVIGDTVKERVTDPVIDKGTEVGANVVEGVVDPIVESDAEKDAKDRVTSMFVRGYQLDPSMVSVEAISLESYREIQLGIDGDTSVTWDNVPDAEKYTFSVTSAGRPYIVITWRDAPETEWLYNATYTGE